MKNGIKTKLTCTMYSTEEENALMSALELCAKEDNEAGDIYKYLEHIPKTSFIAELVNALERFNYKIIKNK